MLKQLFKIVFIPLFGMIYLTLTPCSAAIDFKKNSIIVDDEVDEILKDWVGQLFKVAGLKDHQPKIYLIVNPDINASATIGGVIVINTGLITKSENVGQLLGVLAHEVGHIAGGHVSKVDQAMREAMVPASAAMILGGALAAATGNPSLLFAGLIGSGHAFERTLLRFSRTQESSADHAAIQYLTKLGWGVDGLCDFLKIMDKKTSHYTSIMSPYAMTHPLTVDRVRSIEHHVQGNTGKCSACMEATFQRLKGKILGFFEPPAPLLQSLSSKGLSPEGQQYAKSIALYRVGRHQEALSELDNLINLSGKDSPQAPWYIEMKGQILFDIGQIPQAIQLLEQASNKRPSAKYLKIMLAHALLEQKGTNAVEKAKQILIPITQQDPEDVFAWRLLAQAHGKDNEPGLAALALAEEAFQKRDLAFAHTQVQKAIKILPKDSVGAQRARDLLHSLGAKAA